MSDAAAVLERLPLSSMSRHFARFVAGLAQPSPGVLELAAALVSQAAEQGHVCLDLGAPGNISAEDGQDLSASLPAPAEWSAALRACPQVARPGEIAPLVLDDRGRLYLYRYWRHEQSLAAEMRRRAAGRIGVTDEARLRDGLARLFGGGADTPTDWQRVAALAAVLHPLCVISGGPGTGKTSTVVKILALLLEQAGDNPLRIALAAPTGKAAARLAEAIGQARDGLALDEGLRRRIPHEAQTLHRLLGSGRRPGFRHHRDNPLPAEVVIVDEASMVDLSLMAALVDALDPAARLILLGDRDQLASVEAGAVLGDLCGPAEVGFSAAFTQSACTLSGDILPQAAPDQVAPLADNVIQLRRSYRFAPGSGIAQVAQAIKQGEGSRTLALLRDPALTDIAWRPLPSREGFTTALEPLLLEAFAPYLQATDPGQALAAFERFRLLCALRRGPWGVESLNRLAERLLARQGLVAPQSPYYHGRPILVTGNDYRQGLFNGDVGLIWSDPESGGALRAFFSQGGGLRKILPSRLPGHETVFAMTVHKSQGSEFDRVLLLLPDADTALLSRELLYTAVTRARAAVDIWADEALLSGAVGRRIQRSSGLRDALWDTPHSAGGVKYD
ncbi:exodeoxyribonuclease V subunit alpha [Geoalkalibacter halelectricus]|uniref:Exodeoxyribonuclease V subunit alpha n=1 Tax=Geoalkalibacter halelectricus TaxID=2847045 RepID=A0ABY5ZRS6_9BACT|nr:exodeoxyribonuclease V subunit alpha [Geoalkalibacter halelectricus]MDO3376662.1 exodeoxyribonuclease V subunit alpha [Geoalkalibacter halelectricus]UWZ81386.1 exodeoxyribonuclease V subunit alpha [Geoalkalibacter halelectricus]